ncbi:MAG: TlpA family protein disulfide reductase [Cytophagales bacterium]|nr:TlpA family protein disulfide reductase [Cytophagales bacterium]
MKKIFVAVLLVFSSFWVSAQQVAVIKIDQLQSLLSKNNDTLYVVNFWATLCAPCVEELPHFEQVNKEFSAKKVKVILVSMDFKSKLESKLIPFVNKNKIKSTVVLLDEPDYNAWIDKIDPAWSGAIPATVLSKPSKGIKEFYERPFDYPTLKSLIEKANL